MSLAAGTRIGPYEVVSSVGAGGMGEVYRARDTRLHRDVALKLLPDEFAGDAQRLARFEREAQLLAALHHQNIAGILGLEDAAGQRAIVMEFVDGRELSGPLPVEEALTIARQVAEAIEAAHDRGVIHRDLKPANIKVTADGTVKVLDFGLAKALQGGDDAPAPAHLTRSPTISIGATQAGMVLGTAAYMAPEQAKGRPADRRADIWAFGVVLHELLTGRRLFGGDSAAETLASVMKDPIALDALPADTPPAVRRLLARCLERDVRRRLQSIGEARIVIEDVLAGTGADRALEPRLSPAGPRRSWLPWAAAAAALAVATVAVGWNGRPPARENPVVGRFKVSPPEGAVLTNLRTTGPQLAVSPDGRFLAFVADEPGRGPSLWIQELNALVAQRLERTTNAYFPFWSPDSQHIGYFANGKLMRAPVTGGAPLTLCDAPDGEGGTWFQADGEDAVIVFGGQGPLHRVPAGGGVPTPVTTMLDGEDNGHVFPQFLPGGRRVLFTARGRTPGIYAQTIDSGERTRILDVQARAVFTPPGYLVYDRDGVLLVQRLDLDTMARDGEPIAVAEDVRRNSRNAAAAFSVSAAGVLAYRSGATENNARVRWYARDGTAEALVLEPGGHNHLELSPDGRLLAVSLGDSSNRDLWVKDLSSGTFSRLTSLPGSESQPAWSPDSRQLAFMGSGPLYYTTVGSGTQQVVPGSEGYTLLEQWTPDGRFLVARTGMGFSTSASLIPAPHEGETAAPSAPPPRVVFTHVVDHFQVSRDGRWVAYTSEESGRAEVMIAPFPAFAPRRQLSVTGGAQPRWRADSRELFFVSPDQQMMAVAVTPGDTLQTGPVRALFRTNPAVLSNQIFNYAVAPDGQRFLLREPLNDNATSAVEPLYVVMNWTALVK